MAYSADVAAGDQATAAQYNALRDDIPYYVELAGAENKKTTGDSAWEDWDISAIIPAGTIAVEVGLGNDVGAPGSSQMGVRTNGSALDRWMYVPSPAQAINLPITTVQVTPDASRIIEIWAANHTANGCSFHILGYWIGVGI